MNCRRILTGLDDQGRSCVIADGDAPMVVSRGANMAEITELWLAEAMPASVDGGDLTTGSWRREPPKGGLRWRVVTWPAGDGSRTGHMHRTPTLDLLFVVSGSIILELESGEVTLEQGDSVVLRGDVHAWHNVEPTPCVMVAAMVGADADFAPSDEATASTLRAD